MEVYARVRELYTNAYKWEAPDISNAREYSSSARMREYIRLWINTWDLRRLYNYEADVMIEAVPTSYNEDPDLQHEAVEEEDEPYITV